MLLVKEPKLFGSELYGICTRGNMYDIPKYKGRGIALCIGPARDCVDFLLVKNKIGSQRTIVLRKSDDPELALEVNFRKYSQIENPLSLWSNKGHADWACRFMFNKDQTLAPLDTSNKMAPTKLVLGLKEPKTWHSTRSHADIVLVRRDDHKRRLVFYKKEDAQRFKARIETERKNQKLKEVEMARQVKEFVVTPGMLRQLKLNGFVHLARLVPKALIDTARKEINRMIGIGSVLKGEKKIGINELRGKLFSNQSAITNLFNKSAISLVVKALLGGDKPYVIDRGQVALRFPGDMCIADTAKSNETHFKHIRRAWHIDGCPNDFIPGVTDHFGKIQNFDCLVGVLLADVPYKMNGELCCYGGSHKGLSEYFSLNDGRALQEVKREGNSKLPTGPQTDSLFDVSRLHHCIGKAGDVFIANYMTAHFVAPNTGPDIRYAVYFRVHNHKFPHRGPNREVSMLQPWVNWPSMSAKS